MIDDLVTSYRNWKTEFFFVSSFWAGHPVEVGRDPFAPYIGELRNLRPEGVRLPSLNRFYLERVQKARLHPERDFHSLVTLQRLATWGLGPEPFPEATAHERTVCRLSQDVSQTLVSQPFSATVVYILKVILLLQVSTMLLQN
ncbi:hypothetical protein ACB092_10G095000 [Castanea dentata]